MKASLRPRVTIWRLMLVVALAAAILAGVLPLWRHWFASPIRTIIDQFPGSDRPTTVTCDVRSPWSAKELRRMRTQFDQARFPYRIERAPADPEDLIGSPRPRPRPLPER